MKRILMFMFLIGLFAAGCSFSPDSGVKQPATKARFVQVADQQVHADIIYAVDESAMPAADTPAPIKWVDENLWTTASGVLLLIYEFLALKMPTSKSISILGNLYKLMTWFVPDKSKSGSQFSIRDKL